MSDTVKLIIEIPKEDMELLCKTSFVEDERTMFKQSPSDRQGTMMLFRLMDSVKDGTPLDSNDSDYAEAQAYFDGQAYGWEQGQKDFAEKLKAEIKRMEYHMIDCDVLVSQEEVLDIIDKHISAEKDNIWERITETMKK